MANVSAAMFHVTLNVLRTKVKVIYFGTN